MIVHVVMPRVRQQLLLLMVWLARDDYGNDVQRYAIALLLVLTVAHDLILHIASVLVLAFVVANGMS